MISIVVVFVNFMIVKCSPELHHRFNIFLLNKRGFCFNNRRYLNNETAFVKLDSTTKVHYLVLLPDECISLNLQ